MSVYLQTFFSIVLLFFREGDDLIDGNYKNSGLTLYAIALSLAVTPAHHSSVQSDVVLHSLVMIFLFSMFAMMSLRDFLHGTMYVVSLVGAVPLALWLFVLVIKEIIDTHCYQFTVAAKAPKSHTPLFVIFWSLSMAFYILAIPTFSFLWFPKFHDKLQKGPRKLMPMGLWFLTWFFMIICCEIAIHSFQFRDADYQLTPLTAQEWQFGQVMAVVMVFLQLYDILKYPLKPSRHGGKRIVYWRDYKLKPFCRKCTSRRDLANGSFQTVGGNRGHCGHVK